MICLSAENRNRCKGSALVNFSFVLALVSCAASGFLYVQWNSLSAEKNEFEAVRIQLGDQIASLETDLQAALREQQVLKQTSEEADGEKSKVLAELENVKGASEILRGDLAKLKKERSALIKLAVQMKSEAAQRLSETDSPSESVNSNGVLSSSAHLQSASNQPSRPMRIKTINRTFNFVVFELVPGVSLRVGDDVVVERNGRWISDLRVKQVYAQFVSAEIRKENDDKLLQLSDSVKRV